MADERKAAPVANDQNGNPMILSHNKSNESYQESQTPEEWRGPLKEVANRLLIVDLLRDQPNAKHGPFKYIYFDPEDGSILLRGKGRAQDEFVTVPPGSFSEALAIAVMQDVKKIKVIKYRDRSYSETSGFLASCEESGIRVWYV